ncbi:hypothetical protein [Streptomyces sp. NPDC046925]|uniref:hypothetical protein n=1 Tax=Streptomyces sp. NPDC046925 TaxID=3155375 RepID=UPI00340F7D88
MLEIRARVPGPLARAARRVKNPRHARANRRRGRLHRRLLAYRDVRIVHSPAPAPRAQSLLLVYTRRIVGHLTYEVCERCARGLITEVYVASPLQDSGLGTRAVSHLRACYPGITWRSCLTQRMTRDLAHRMRLPLTAPQPLCTHTRTSADNATQPTLD